jgi:hypothetical protein
MTYPGFLKDATCQLLHAKNRGLGKNQGVHDSLQLFNTGLNRKNSQQGNALPQFLRSLSAKKTR